MVLIVDQNQLYSVLVFNSQYIIKLFFYRNKGNRFTLSSGIEEGNSEYSTQLFGDTYLLRRADGIATLCKNGETIFSFTAGVRVICDRDLNVLRIIGMECNTVNLKLTMQGKVYEKDITPNECCEIKNGELVTVTRVRFDLKK